MTTILISSMGGSGSLNLVDTLRLFDKEGRFQVVGTHFSPYELAKSDLEHLYTVPKARAGAPYIEAHLRIIEKHKVDLLIANSDQEAAAFARRQDDIPCKHLLPRLDQVEAVQDKYQFYTILKKQGCQSVPNVPIQSRDRVAEAIEKLRLTKGERFWIRLREGAGSQGATWLHTAEQAEKWIDLWNELRGVKPEDFIVAPFLSGRDFCVSTLFQDGALSVAKVYERLAYYAEDVSLSMMGSTPKTSQTVKETAPIDAAVQAVEAISREFGVKPHGLYQADLKCDMTGCPYVTEINIGRFPMTSPQFDRVGKYSQFQLYIQLALEPQKKLPRRIYDLDPGWVFLRGVDVPLIIERAERVAALEANVPVSPESCEPSTPA
jgi:hypothetical protein